MRIFAPALAALFALGCAACRKPAATPQEIDIEGELPLTSATEIERRLTIPLERLLNGAPGLTRLWSTSREDHVTLHATFETAMPEVRRELRERLLDKMATLPVGSSISLPPRGPVAMRYTLRADSMTRMELSAIASSVRERLQQIAGVSGAATCGATHERTEVVIAPERLAALGISLNDVVTALARDEKSDLEAVGRVQVLERSGAPILVRDVAAIASGEAPRRCFATRDGLEVLAGEVWAAPSADLAQVAAETRSNLSAIKATLPPGVELEAFSGSTLVRAHLSAGETAQLPRLIADPELGAGALMFAEPPQLRAYVEEPAAPALIDRLSKRPALSRPALAGAELQLTIYDSDLEALERVSNRLAEIFRGIPGVAGLEVEGIERAPAISVEPDRDLLANLGVSPLALELLVSATQGGLKVGPNLVMIVPGATDPKTLAQISIVTSSGKVLPLSQLAQVRLESRPVAIRRERNTRCAMIRLFTPLASRAEVQALARRTLEATPMPAGMIAQVVALNVCFRAAR
jgi:Cu/Ag efflux pump CusA